MGRDLADRIPECRAVFDHANDVLGFDLADICFEGPREKLMKSSHAQPGIFVVSVAALTALNMERPDVVFDACAGLSSGEWAALYYAGVVSFEDTVKVLEARGRFMQEACEARPGGMVGVIGLDEEALRNVAEASGVEIANFNSPGQTVLSGPAEGIETAERMARDAGAKRAIRLEVAGAFHSSLMRPAAEKLSDYLSDVPLALPTIPVVSNVTGELHDTPEGIRSLMVEQVTASVRWVSDVECLAGMGVTTYVECGPGKVLTGLVRRIDKEAGLHNIQDQSALEAAARSLKKMDGVNCGT